MLINLGAIPSYKPRDPRPKQDLPLDPRLDKLHCYGAHSLYIFPSENQGASHFQPKHQPTYFRAHIRIEILFNKFIFIISNFIKYQIN